MMRRAAWVFLLGIALASTAPLVVAAEDQTAYFLGEVRISAPNGQVVGNSLSLVKRTLKPVENRIIEVVASIDLSKPAKEFTTVFEVDGSRFVMKDAEGTFTGSGELTGTAWQWTGWKYEVEFTGGPARGRLKGEDVLGAGGLTAKKWFMSPDGVVRAQFAEELSPVSRAVYDILHTKLMPAPK